MHIILDRHGVVAGFRKPSDAQQFQNEHAHRAYTLVDDPALDAQFERLLGLPAAVSPSPLVGEGRGEGAPS